MSPEETLAHVNALLTFGGLYAEFRRRRAGFAETRKGTEILGYIDPGSGSYLFQLLIGTAVGVGAVLILPFRKFFGRLLRRRSRDSSGQPLPQDPEV